MSPLSPSASAPSVSSGSAGAARTSRALWTSAGRLATGSWCSSWRAPAATSVTPRAWACGDSSTRSRLPAAGPADCSGAATVSSSYVFGNGPVVLDAKKEGNSRVSRCIDSVVDKPCLNRKDLFLAYRHCLWPSLIDYLANSIIFTGAGFLNTAEGSSSNTAISVCLRLPRSSASRMRP